MITSDKRTNDNRWWLVVGVIGLIVLVLYLAAQKATEVTIATLQQGSIVVLESTYGDQARIQWTNHKEGSTGLNVQVEYRTEDKTLFYQTEVCEGCVIPLYRSNISLKGIRVANRTGLVTIEFEPGWRRVSS